ncbi:MAG TPA: GNAT family N-acetyltransferase [Acidimicrobiia bacterium]|jgi:GNAT superfamily N-acetyltransferase
MTGERELPPGETQLAYAALSELRPHVASVDEFVEMVNGAQRPEGYRLVGSFADGGEPGAPAVSAAGFRRLHNLAWGDLLYIDDLVTMEAHRGRGHAHRLLDWVVTEARRLGCRAVHLDSAPHRHTAHRLYLNEGYRISSFHFSREV